MEKQNVEITNQMTLKEEYTDAQIKEIYDILDRKAEIVRELCIKAMDIEMDEFKKSYKG